MVSLYCKKNLEVNEPMDLIIEEGGCSGVKVKLLWRCQNLYLDLERKGVCNGKDMREKDKEGDRKK